MRIWRSRQAWGTRRNRIGQRLFHFAGGYSGKELSITNTSALRKFSFPKFLNSIRDLSPDEQGRSSRKDYLKAVCDCVHLRECDEQKASRLIKETLKSAHWTAADLPNRPKGHPAKAKMARRLRSEIMTWPWIAEQLVMCTGVGRRTPFAACKTIKPQCEHCIVH